MKLTRLRLIGFKSFVEPTDFQIEPGLTGVVGPNGCGKSNLVEALRWVMGETSYKSMRAAAMDAFFSGTNNRRRAITPKSRSRSTTASTSAGHFNEFETLDIHGVEARGRSMYNGREVRARDVMTYSPSLDGRARPRWDHRGIARSQAKPEQARRC